MSYLPVKFVKPLKQFAVKHRNTSILTFSLQNIIYICCYYFSRKIMFLIKRSSRRFRGCSYENNFPFVFPVIREKDIISLRSYTKYFLTWARFILAGYWVGKCWEKPIFKMGDINLKENGSVLLHLNVSGLDPHFMFDGSSTTIRYSKTT